MDKHTKEGKTAEKIISLVNDLTLDLEMVGIYLADISSSVLYNRLCQVFDSARHQKEYRYSEEYREKMRKIEED